MMVEKFFFRKFNKCCAFLMLLLFASGTLWAGHSPEKITMKVTNEKLVKVLEEIKKQSGYNFVYNEKFVKDLGGITVDVKEVSLDSVMKEVLEGTGLRYRCWREFCIGYAGWVSGFTVLFYRDGDSRS